MSPTPIIRSLAADMLSGGVFVLTEIPSKMIRLNRIPPNRNCQDLSLISLGLSEVHYPNQPKAYA